MGHHKRRNGRPNDMKRGLRLPDLGYSGTAVKHSLPAQSSQDSYRRAIHEFIEWYCSEPRLAPNRAVSGINEVNNHLFQVSGAPCP